jgi:hypothetical protein
VFVEQANPCEQCEHGIQTHHTRRLVESVPDIIEYTACDLCACGHEDRLRASRPALQRTDRRPRGVRAGDGEDEVQTRVTVNLVAHSRFRSREV